MDKKRRRDPFWFVYGIVLSVLLVCGACFLIWLGMTLREYQETETLRESLQVSAASEPPFKTSAPPVSHSDTAADADRISSDADTDHRSNAVSDSGSPFCANGGACPDGFRRNCRIYFRGKRFSRDCTFFCGWHSHKENAEQFCKRILYSSDLLRAQPVADYELETGRR